MNDSTPLPFAVAARPVLCTSGLAWTRALSFTAFALGLCACQGAAPSGALSTGGSAATGANSSAGSSGSMGTSGTSSSSSTSSRGSTGTSDTSSSGTTGSSGASSNATSSSGSTGTSNASSSSGTSSSGGSQAPSPTDLDPTGTTIPDTDYAIPSGAIFLSTQGAATNPGTESAPVATLNQAIAKVPTAGTIVVRGGTYRDAYTASGNTYKVATKAFTLQAYPHEQVWFDGTALEPSGWTPDGAGHWSRSWSTPQFCNGGYDDHAYDAQPTANTGPCTHYDMYGDPANPAAGDPQMVFIDGVAQHEVAALADATAGTFFYDWVNKKLSIATNPAGHTVELAVRPVALVLGGGGGFVIRGIGFRRYATNEYSNTTSGAVYASGPTTVENCVFTGMAAQGVYINGSHGVLRHSVLALNGFNGMGSNGHQHSTGAVDGLVIEDNLVVGNNTEKFGTGCSVSCAQAGIKIAHMDGFRLENNILAHNNGSGFWCDLACSNGFMVHNASYDNQGAGLFYEVSDTGIIASNLVHDNVGYGIRVGSANTKVFNNTVVNNTQYGGIWIYDDGRSPGVGGWTDVGPDTVNVAFENNIVVDTLGSNTLVRVTAASTTAPNTQPSQFFSALDFNAYYRTTAGQNLVRWIPSAGETDYKSASAFTAAQAFDANAIDVSDDSVPIVDLAGGDYTVKGSSSAHGNATPLPADVAAALGVSSTAPRDRGAITWPGR